MFHGEWLGTMLSEFAASALLVGAGFLVGRYRERRRLRGKDLHQYDFYPYVATAEKFAAICINIDITHRCLGTEVGRAHRRVLS
jgi:hypothetical protein